MIRVRSYRFTLSMPLILVIAAVVTSVVSGSSLDIGLNAGTLLFAAGLALQLIFSICFACPKCGKSPYSIGPNVGPFSLAGKPLPDVRCSRCGYDFVVGKEPTTVRDGQN